MSEVYGFLGRTPLSQNDRCAARPTANTRPPGRPNRSVSLNPSARRHTHHRKAAPTATGTFPWRGALWFGGDSL